MNTMILKVCDTSLHAEVLYQEENKPIIEKIVNIQQAIKELNFMLGYEQQYELDFMDTRYLYVKETENTGYYVYLMDEQKIKCTFEGKGYSLSHPNSIFIIRVDKNSKRFTSISVYCFKKFEGRNTELFTYPFPNMLVGNKICTGTVKNVFVDAKQVIMDVLESNYTHSDTNFIHHPLKSTKKAFEYLSNNPFPYYELSSLNYNLDYVIRRIKNE